MDNVSRLLLQGQRAQAAEVDRHYPDDDGVLDDIGHAIDNTPRAVAIIALGALAALILLKQAGFRFSFGVGAKIGK